MNCLPLMIVLPLVGLRVVYITWSLYDVYVWRAWEVGVRSIYVWKV